LLFCFIASGEAKQTSGLLAAMLLSPSAFCYAAKQAFGDKNKARQACSSALPPCFYRLRRFATLASPSAKRSKQAEGDKTKQGRQRRRLRLFSI
jgi:hypothetical protein